MDQVTFKEVRIQTQSAIGEYNELLTPDHGKETETKMVLSHFKISWCRRRQSYRKQCMEKEEGVDRRRSWIGMNIASLTRAAGNRTRWKGTIAGSFVVRRRLSKTMGYNRTDKE